MFPKGAGEDWIGIMKRRRRSTSRNGGRWVSVRVVGDYLSHVVDITTHVWLLNYSELWSSQI